MSIELIPVDILVRAEVTLLNFPVTLRISFFERLLGYIFVPRDCFLDALLPSCDWIAKFRNPKMTWKDVFLF